MPPPVYIMSQTGHTLTWFGERLKREKQKFPLNHSFRQYQISTGAAFIAQLGNKLCAHDNAYRGHGAIKARMSGEGCVVVPRGVEPLSSG
jgi:hypothetical protein